VSAEVVELPPGDSRLALAWEVMAQLRPHRDPSAMDAVYQEAHPLGYRVTARFGDGACRAVAGWRIGVNLHLGRNLYVEDLVTDSAVRSAGHGAALLDHLRGVARVAGCRALHLDSGVQRHEAHRFYFRERLHISSHHFLEEL
jgi:GNAT superfamily N-acetyltransferase